MRYINNQGGLLANHNCVQQSDEIADGINLQHKVNRSEQESFDKRYGKTCGKIIECCYKKSLAHKRETKGVKHGT